MFAILRAEAAFVAGAVSAALLFFWGDLLLADLGSIAKVIGLFAWVFGVMLWCAFGVVRHADSLAALLREPYGTLILTISVITIEVALIAAIMLTGGATPTLARDTMMAVLMIVLNGMVGLSLLIGGLRNVEQKHNFQGSQAFLAVIATLATMSLILPSFTVSTEDPSLTPLQSVLFAVVTVALYATFLAMQTVRHRGFFMQPERTSAVRRSASSTAERTAAEAPAGAAAAPVSGNGDGAATVTDDGDEVHHETRSMAYHAVFLVLTLVPIVVLSKTLALVVDFATLTLKAPVALGGVLVAVVVLAPEGMAAIRAALGDRIQRSINICLGSALATIGLTVPAVLATGLLSGEHVVLGVGSTDMLLLVLTLFLCVVTFGGARTNMLLGAVHLVVFFVYLVLIFRP